MAALWNRAGHYIFIVWFLLSFFFFFSFFSSPNLSRRRLDVYHTWCGLSANLGCRCETCCTWLAENTGHTKSPTIRHLRTIEQFCRAVPSQLRHVSTIGKKLLNSNISPRVLTISWTSAHALTADIGSGVLGNPANFNGFRVLAKLRYCTDVALWGW